MYQQAEILLIEGDPGDVRLTQECFREHKLTNTLNVVSSGLEALRFLRQEGEYACAAPPDMILSCISVLWEQDISHLLCHIDQDSRLRKIPLVVLTAFEGEEVMLEGKLCATSLSIPKPLTIGSIQHIVKHFGSFGFAISKKSVSVSN